MPVVAIFVLPKEPTENVPEVICEAGRFPTEEAEMDPDGRDTVPPEIVRPLDPVIAPPTLMLLERYALLHAVPVAPRSYVAVADGLCWPLVMLPLSIDPEFEDPIRFQTGFPDDAEFEKLKLLKLVVTVPDENSDEVVRMLSTDDVTRVPVGAVMAVEVGS